MAGSYNIQEIRLLPMDKEEEFPTEKEARKYLATELIVPEDGKYYYRERGIIIDNYNALILFQYDASIIGYGVLNDVVSLQEKEVHTATVNGKTVQYHGYYKFIPSSVHNVEKISLNGLQQIVGDIQFGNAKRHIDIKYYASIRKKLLEKQVEFAQNRVTF